MLIVSTRFGTELVSISNIQSEYVANTEGYTDNDIELNLSRLLAIQNPTKFRSMETRSNANMNPWGSQSMDSPPIKKKKTHGDRSEWYEKKRQEYRARRRARRRAQAIKREQTLIQKREAERENGTQDTEQLTEEVLHQSNVTNTADPVSNTDNSVDSFNDSRNHLTDTAQQHHQQQHNDQDPITTTTNALTIDVNELKSMIFGKETDSTMMSFQKNGEFNYMVLNPTTSKPLTSLEPQIVKLNGRPIALGSLHVEVESPHIPIRNFNIGARNMGWNKPVNETTVKKGLNNLIKATKGTNADLICLQEVKVDELFTGTLDHDKKFIKISPQDWTGFLTNPSIGESRIAKLDEDGMISVLSNPCLPSLVYNVCFRSNDSFVQFQQDQILEIGLQEDNHPGSSKTITGDLNAITDDGADFMEHPQEINQNERDCLSHERQLVTFLSILFKRFGILDIFRQSDSDTIGATNTPKPNPNSSANTKRRLNRICVQRFAMNDYLFRILKENKRISTHDLTSIINKKYSDLLYDPEHKYKVTL